MASYFAETLSGFVGTETLVGVVTIGDTDAYVGFVQHVGFDHLVLDWRHSVNGEQLGILAIPFGRIKLVDLRPINAEMHHLDRCLNQSDDDSKGDAHVR